jgi:site-specific DNA-cytosine methylase
LTPLRAIIELIRRQHPNVLWMVECTIFGRIFKNHHYTPHLEPRWQYVKTRFEELEHESQPFAEKIINFEDGLLPQARRRQLMYNFAIHEDWPKDDVTYSDILKSVKGETDRKKAKTIMAGTNSSVRREGLNNYTVNGVETGPSPEIEEQLQGLPGGDNRGPGYTT